MADSAPILVWFRHDLRLIDHPALAAAAATGRAVVPVHLFDPEGEGRFPPGAASRWWLHHSLIALDQGLRRLGSRLVCRAGTTAAAIERLLAETGATAVFWNRRHEPAAAALEADIAARLQSLGVAAHAFDSSLLFVPGTVLTKDGAPYRVFTRFWEACRTLGPPALPVPAPQRLAAPAAWPPSDRLEDWRLLPTAPDWAGGLRQAWSPGEAGAERALESFLDRGLADYAASRDRPDLAGTSRLSPHLHFGEMSPRRLWHAGVARGGDSAGTHRFLTELGWREFSYHLLHHFPTLPIEPMQPAFSRFPWSADPRLLRAWQRGRTGYPIVDAGMRELWSSGWMHNRVRMIVASFLVKDLMISWQEGAAWFWDTLVDADLANNAASWQWVAGSGADAAPYFRIFNPVLQGEKFDPDGAYVRRWVPELAKLPKPLIHRPWTADAATLAAAGVRLGIDYPQPIVDHAFARKRALAAFAALKDRAA